jgi:uncharacterized protein
MMLSRRLKKSIQSRLEQFPAVALLGPRQVGKTTLAKDISQEFGHSLYLDLENPDDREKLKDPRAYLALHSDKLVVLDEVQRAPELFQTLRGLIDSGIQEGRKTSQFLLLGSASMDLLRQSGESLAGRIAYIELCSLDVLEVGIAELERLWVRGGFPESFLAKTDDQSALWRESFIRTYLERDIPQFGPRIPSETLRRFWTMLAHNQGGILNAAQLASALAVDGKTVARYLDLMVDLLLVRRLMPFHANIGKRLVKSPKIYVRDSGLVHSLLRLPDRESILGHPIAGMSWEGLVLEMLQAIASERSQASFYRTFSGAEIDLLLELPGGKTWAIEVKRGQTARPEKGFYSACTDIQPDRAFVVYAGQERYPISDNIEAISVMDMAKELTSFTHH